MNETQTPPQKTSWIAVLAKVKADIEDRLKTLPGVVISNEQPQSDFHRFFLQQEKGECTIEIRCDYPKYSYHSDDINGIKIKAVGPYDCAIRNVTWHRNAVPVDLPYDKIIKRVVDILTSSHESTVRKEKERDRQNMNLQEMVALCDGLLTPEEVRLSGMIRKVYDQFVVQIPNLTASQARRILEIAHEPKSRRSY